MRASCFWVWIFFWWSSSAAAGRVRPDHFLALGARARAFISFALAIVEKQR